MAAFGPSDASVPSWQETLIARHRARSSEERAAIKKRGMERTDAEFERLMKEKAAADRASHPSFEKIPRFFAGRGGRTLQQMLRTLAEAKCHEEFERQILSWDELEQLRLMLARAQSEPMDGSNRINYEQLCEVRRELEEQAGSDVFKKSLSARTFLRHARDQHGRISARDLYDRVDRETCASKTFLTMRPYDGRGTGSLRESELERYIYDFIPEMPLAQSMDEKFHAFYVFTAVRRFMFFLDPKRRGRIPIHELAASDISAELHEMADVTRESEARSLRKSWFLPDNAKRVYSDYLELDEDHNGMLSKAELLNFRGLRGEARLTKAFVERVYAEIITYRTNEATGEGEMDFKTYLDLVLAFENLSTPQALAYFWRLLDVKKQGHLDTFTINFFFREIGDSIRDEGYDAPHTADVVDEIFDMIRPKDPTQITFDDLQASKQAHTVISMLTDVAGFLAYDNREHMMQPEDDDLDDF